MSADSAEQKPEDDRSGASQYGRGAVRKSLRHFAVGKGMNFVASLAALLLLTRWLETTEYGAYIALRGFIEVARVITTIGVSAVLYRYLPELRAAGNNVAAYRLLKYGMLIRMAWVALILLTALAFSESLGITFNIREWIWLIPMALLVGALDYAVVTLSQSLESFLWQKEAQYALAAGNLFKIALFIALVVSGELSLPYVVFVEAFALLLSLALLGVGLFKRWSADQDRSHGDVGWIRANLRRMMQFGAWAFGLNLSALLYGPGPNRLLVANQLPIGDLATFGFASTLAQLGRRMMPARLTSTMLRPLLVAKYSLSANFDKVSHLSNLVMRFNISLLLVPIGILIIAGEPVLDVVSNGKYGEAAWLLVGFLVILIAEGTRQLLGLAAQAVERNDLMIYSSLVQSSSLFLAIAMIPYLGVWAVLSSNFIGTVLANVVLIKVLRRVGFNFQISWKPIGLIILEGLVAIGLGWSLDWVLANSALGAVLGTASFIATFTLLYWLFPPYNKEELDTIKSVISRKGKKKRKETAETNESDSL